MKPYLYLLLGTYARTNHAQDACSTYSFSLELKDECSLHALNASYEAYVARPENEICALGDLDTLLDEQNVDDICRSAINRGIDFDQIVNQDDSKFVESFYRGGTYWNEEVETKYDLDNPNGPAINILKKDLVQIPTYYDLAQQKKVNYPQGIDNLDISNCDINAVMCCWPQDRQANDNNGNCNAPYDQNCIDKDPADNTDLCGVHLDRSNSSNNLNSDGFSFFEGDNNNGEGTIHCHGLAFSNNDHDAETRYMGNNLFYISMYDHLYKRGYTRNIPGSPMCGCVEQMPVVTRSDCTQVDVTETFTFNYEPTSGFSATISDIDIDFNACQGENNKNNDLSAYVARLYNEGKVTLTQKNELKEHLVENNNCPRAIARNLASKGIVRGFPDGAYQETYSFPPTDTNQFVHGICVKGASRAGAFSDNNLNLDYKVVPDFKDGVVLWGDRTYVASGVKGDAMCEGGIFLQPSKHKTIHRFSDITVGANPIDGNYVSVCVFVEPGKGRNGKWEDILPDYSFEASGEFNWSNEQYAGTMKSYCKTLPEPPTFAPTIAPTIVESENPIVDVSYTFPYVKTGQFVHGLCVLGATNVEANSSFSGLKYTAVQGFGKGTKLWDNRGYLVDGDIQGSDMCAGGTYLRPSRHKKIPRNTEITFNGESSTGGFVKLCAFVISSDGRTGKWDTTLPSLGFEVSESEFTWGNGMARMKSYCKSIS